MAIDPPQANRMSRSWSCGLRASPWSNWSPRPVRVAPPPTKSRRDPSQLTILPPTAASSGAWVRTATSSSSQAGSARVSLLTKATTSASTWRAARLLPPANPRLRFERTIRTEGKRSRTRSTEPSVDPLSASTTWKGPLYVCAAREARQSARCSRPFQLRATMATEGMLIVSFSVPRPFGWHPHEAAVGQVVLAHVQLDAPVPVVVGDAVLPVGDGHRQRIAALEQVQLIDAKHDGAAAGDLGHLDVRRPGGGPI